MVGDSQSDRAGGVHDVPPIARARRGRLVTTKRPRVERLPPALATHGPRWEAMGLTFCRSPQIPWPLNPDLALGRP